VSGLSFDFTLDQNSISSNSLLLNFLFGSSEIIGAQFTDVAAIIVDGINYAKLPNGSILVVKPEAGLRDTGNPSDTYSCWWNSYQSTPTQPLYITNTDGTISSICSLSTTGDVYASLDPTLSTHHVDFVVSDVSDRAVPSFLGFAFPQAQVSTFSGIFYPNSISAPVISMVSTGSAIVTFANAFYDSTYTAQVYDANGSLIETIPNFTSGSTINGLSPL
jgi:hypothetical protein